MNEYLLTMYLMAAPTQVYANPEQEALKHIGKAMYKELAVDKMVQNLEKRYVPKDMRPYLGYTGTVVRLVTEQKVTFIWRF